MAIEDYFWMGDGAGVIAGGVLAAVLVLALISYIITGLSFMKIAHRTHTPHAWLAWIPIANIFLITNIAKQPWWVALVIILVGIIPFIGPIISAAAFVYVLWKINEILGKPGPLAILGIFPVVNLIYFLYLAYS